MIIRDGRGSGRNAGVDSRFRLNTFSVTEAEDKHANREGRTWTASSASTAVGADDYIFYFENTGAEVLVITDVRAFASAATTLWIDAVSGVPTYAAGVDVSATARNLGSSRVPDAVIKQDTNTTGITSEGDLFFIRCDTADKTEHLRTSSNIIVPQGGQFAIRTSVATLVTMIVSISVLE